MRVITIVLLILSICIAGAVNVSISKYSVENFQAKSVAFSGNTAIFAGNGIIAVNDSGIVWKKSIASNLISASKDYIAIASGRDVYLLSSNGTTLWSKRLESAVTSISVTENGNVTVGTVAGDVYLFNSTGGKVWEYRVGNVVESVSSQKDFVAVSDVRGKIYYFEKFGKFPWTFTSNKILNWVYKTGWCIWEFDGISKLCTYPEVFLKVCNDVLVVSKFMQNVYLFSKSGYLIWNKSFPEKPISFDGNGKVFAIGFKDGMVSVFNREGKLLWNVNFGSAALVSVSKNYTAVGSGKLITLFDNKGKVLWIGNAPGKIKDLAVSDSGRIAFCCGGAYYIVPEIKESAGNGINKAKEKVKEIKIGTNIKTEKTKVKVNTNSEKRKSDNNRNVSKVKERKINNNKKSEKFNKIYLIPALLVLAVALILLRNRVSSKITKSKKVNKKAKRKVKKKKKVSQ